MVGCRAKRIEQQGSSAGVDYYALRLASANQHFSITARTDIKDAKVFGCYVQGKQSTTMLPIR